MLCLYQYKVDFKSNSDTCMLQLKGLPHCVVQLVQRRAFSTFALSSDLATVQPSVQELEKPGGARLPNASALILICIREIEAAVHISSSEC